MADAGARAFPAPLAGFDGRVPPAPAWFEAAVAREPERGRVTVDGAGIEMLTWGTRGKPGLLLLHGNGAHADWWSFIAPFLADDRRVAAMSWSGMGTSDHRDAYSVETFVAEAFAVAEAAGLFDAGPPVFAAHSFGGLPLLAAAAAHGERLRAAVVLDSPILSPEQLEERRRRWGEESPPRPHRVYPTLPAALDRFRFAPPQACETPYIADFIARRSLKEVDGGWTWKFDPNLWTRFNAGQTRPLLPKARCPVALMWGDRSQLVTPEVVAYMATIAPPGTPMIAIPDADHHVMVDQPLAVVAALRALLAGWPKE